MADNKQIRVGVDNSAFEAYESKMRQSSENLAREMIRSSRSYTTSAKETLTTIEEQIRAIEKRNALDRDFREREVTSARESGAISSDEAKSRMSSIGQESKEDKLQTQLLRELIDTVKSTSRQEIREDRVGVEQRIQSSNTVGQLNPQMDEIEALRETIQQQYLSELDAEETTQRGGGMTGAGLQQYGMLPMQFLGSRNALDVAGGAVSAGGSAMGKLGGTGGLIGMIAAATIGKAISVLGSSAETLENQLADRSRLTGAVTANFDPKRYNATNLAIHGMTVGDYMEKKSNLELSSKTRNFGESAANLMYLSGGTTLSEGDVSGLVGLRRFGGGTATGTANFMEQYLKQSGQSMAVLPEIIQQFTTEARNIVMNTGQVDTAQLASVMTTVGGQTGFQGDLLGGAMSTLGKGMQRSSNPVLQAMQFRAARSAAGEGATLWDVEKIMADPMSNPDYMQSMLQSLKSTSGGGQAYERAISNMLGVNPNMAERYAKIDLSEKLTKEQLNNIKEESISYSAKDAKVGGYIGKTGKQLESKRQQVGFDAAQEISEKMLDLVEKIDELSSGLKDRIERNSDENIDELNKTILKLANGDTDFLEKIGLYAESAVRGAASMPGNWVTPGMANFVFGGGDK